MTRFIAAALTAFLSLGAAPAAVLAEDGPRPPAAAPAGEPAGVRTPDRSDDAGLERARAAARAADHGSNDLDRARAAARATDSRFEGLEKAREAVRTADPGGGVDCLSAREARGAISQKKAIPLAQAVRAARDAWDGEVIDYRLCTYDGRLAYDLTLLNDDGKVARARVEALDGKLVGVR